MERDGELHAASNNRKKVSKILNVFFIIINRMTYLQNT